MANETANIAEFAHLDAFYRLLVQNLPKIALLVFDKDMRYVLAEGTYLQAEGYIPSAMIGKTLEEVLPPARYATLSSHYQSALAGEIIEFEGTSAQSFYRSRISPVKDDQGEVIAGMIVTEDITAQKIAEQALRESEARYRSLADHSNDLILQISRDGAYTYVSPSCQRILGYMPAELLGKTFNDFGHPDDINHVTATRLFAIQQPASSGAIIVRFRHKQGHYLWLERTGSPILSEPSHQVIGFVATCRDVTERYTAEESLSNSEERLRLLLETSLDAIMLRDKAGNIRLVNPAACRMFGRSEDELCNMNDSKLFDLDDPRFIHFQKLRETMLTGRVELTGLYKDGTAFPIEVSVSDFTNHEGEVLVWRIIRDVSDRQRYLQLRVEQERLLTTLQKESELSQLKSRMMERVAHEFRTPLAIIGVTLTLITSYLDRLTEEQKQQKSELVHQQIRRLTDMLDEIGLAVQGSLVPEILQTIPFDLKSLCQQIALELEAEFIRSDIFMFDFTNSIIINGNPAVMKTVLIHVMRNAVRFSAPTAQVKIALSLHAQGAELQVTDNGIGVLAEDLPRIFEPFFRGSNIGEISGLGIGLTIAQAAIKAHRGTIKLESTPRQGTTVTISIPQSPF